MQIYMIIMTNYDHSYDIIMTIFIQRDFNKNYNLIILPNLVNTFTSLIQNQQKLLFYHVY